MPLIRFDRKINYILLLLFIFLYLYCQLEKYLPFVVNDNVIISFFLAYILGTELFTPDLDIKSTPSKRLGFIYLPLRLLFHHRGKLHNQFLGWFIQIVYLILVGLMIIIVANKLGYSFNLGLYIDKDYIIGFLIGLFLSSEAHIIADWVQQSSDYKKEIWMTNNELTLEQLENALDIDFEAIEL